MANRLAGETSPYLLQHQDNPVDWYPWGDEALERARQLDRPLLVSIGYSACHWCHVMAHESFEDPTVASLMNESFVPVKVDREERPDIDAVCMEACQGLTGQGGWPLNVFLTPDLRPFFAGTYFPPQQRQGMASWPMVLQAVAGAWQNRREDIERQGEQVARALESSARMAPREDELPESAVADAVHALVQTFDARNGGWGGAPKFPQASVIEFLLTAGEHDMSVATLRAMAQGGIYDQVGGGFSRYAVDVTWTVPHFEKMLYDNALLAQAYLHGWQVSGDEAFRRVCCETLDWALREMRGPEGGFSSALDADSEGVEGKYYVWTLSELREALPDDLADPAIEFFGVTAEGNFEHGSNVLEGRGPVPERLPEIRCQLYGVREQRVRPGLDDKRLTAWNALMIAALADAGAVLERPDYLTAARECARFVLDHLRSEDGRLLRTWKDGQAKLDGYLEDHAFLLQGLLVLYEATFDTEWYAAAANLGETLLDRFADSEHGGFFTTAEDQAHLLVRRKDLEDSPIPSGNSAAALGLLRLARLSGDDRFERAARGILKLNGPVALRFPTGFGHLLQALAFDRAPVREVAIVGEGAEGAGPLARTVRGRFRPFTVLAGGPPEPRDGSLGVPLLAGRPMVGEHPAAYVCERFTCQAPVTDPQELDALLPA
ncbi:MAG TPA: thioredoxin domain-containing protein [Solirubrobacteraceae bacterium]|jgi:hypothetical protein|nr:thioredoxin domain-containing protein [Solirubrobacteraceae bacterium]